MMVKDGKKNPIRFDAYFPEWKSALRQDILMILLSGLFYAQCKKM